MLPDGEGSMNPRPLEVYSGEFEFRMSAGNRFCVVVGDLRIEPDDQGQPCTVVPVMFLSTKEDLFKEGECLRLDHESKDYTETGLPEPGEISYVYGPDIYAPPVSSLRILKGRFTGEVKAQLLAWIDIS